MYQPLAWKYLIADQDMWLIWLCPNLHRTARSALMDISTDPSVCDWCDCRLPVMRSPKDDYVIRPRAEQQPEAKP